MPILHEIISKRDDVKLYHLEANEENSKIVQKFEIISVPTVLVFYNDKIMASCRGFQPEEILEIWLDSKIEDIKKTYKNM